MSESSKLPLRIAINECARKNRIEEPDFAGAGSAQDQRLVTHFGAGRQLVRVITKAALAAEGMEGPFNNGVEVQAHLGLQPNHRRRVISRLIEGGDPDCPGRTSRIHLDQITFGEGEVHPTVRLQQRRATVHVRRKSSERAAMRSKSYIVERHQDVWTDHALFPLAVLVTSYMRTETSYSVC